MKRTCIVLLLLLLLFPGLTLGAKGTEPVPISDRAGLEAIGLDPAGNYVLAADIDMGDGPWVPLAFSGTLDGGGHTLYNLRITAPGPDAALSVDGNHRGGDTVYAALFSVTKKAMIRDLTIRNLSVDVTTDQLCYAAGLVGSGADTEVVNCAVSGRIRLNAAGKICGVAGIMGYGWGLIKDTEADVTLVLVDENREIPCEEFLGGILANGYADVDGCTIKLDGYSSVHGYVHNGGIVGMDHIHPRDRSHRGYVKNCTVDAAITFFENSPARRAYCREYVGERLNKEAILSNNVTVRFDSVETEDYDTVLLPEKCENPAYRQTVTPATDTAFGYTTFVCPVCGYSYTDQFVGPKG